ncbi:hypothetical protein OQX61_12535 [Pedobacter sp. PLR]|uniref:hypothetical protein n=1 Tax=Pedobacter sp. PLR TaxID=2994465 RepID=UPI002245A04A|nr:hypothetical protein [Pedobacter sp. PLR]MCX2452091.1 hypothetical protein [Pedobacter sp. PLR]
MNNNINLIAFGTFGIPNGFRQTPFAGDKENSGRIKSFDLNTNAIKLFPDTRIYSIRKQHINGNNTIAYAVYSFAKEKNSDRGGTFIGSAMVYYNKIAEENLTIKCLDEFHNTLITNTKNINQHVLQVNHSNHFNGLKKPADFDKLELNLKEFGELNFTMTSKDAVVYNLIKPKTLQDSLELLNVYDTVFFTDSPEIAKFVNEKQLFKLIENTEGMENEVKGIRIQIEEEKNRKINQAAAQVETRINQFEDSRHFYFDHNNSLIKSAKDQLSQNAVQIDKFTSQLNTDRAQTEKSADYLIKLGKSFDDQKSKLNAAIQEIKTGTKSPEEVFIRLGKDQQQLDEAKNKLEIPVITKLTESQKTTFFSNNNSTLPDFRTNDHDQVPERSSGGTSLYKVMAIMLFLLWAATTAYFLYYQPEKVDFLRSNQRVYKTNR